MYNHPSDIVCRDPECMCLSQRFADIDSQLNDMHQILINVRDTIVKADTTIATIAGEVKPTLDALMANPMLKMFLNKGGK